MPTSSPAFLVVISLGNCDRHPAALAVSQPRKFSLPEQSLPCSYLIGLEVEGQNQLSPRRLHSYPPSWGFCHPRATSI